jgi:hypothetical protein
MKKIKSVAGVFAVGVGIQIALVQPAHADPNVHEWQPHNIKTGVTWGVPNVGTGPTCIQAEVPATGNPIQTVSTSVCKNDDGNTYRSSYLAPVPGQWVGLKATPPSGVAAACWLEVDGMSVRETKLMAPVGQMVDCLTRVS